MRGRQAELAGGEKLLLTFYEYENKGEIEKSFMGTGGGQCVISHAEEQDTSRWRCRRTGRSGGAGP